MSENMNELIVIEQLPIIREHLETIKANIQEKVDRVLALDCNESTVKAIKVLRADLNKDFKELEERRKQVKNKVLAPYMAFDSVYNECVKAPFGNADAELKKRIDFVEDSIKQAKEDEIRAYFDEYRDSLYIDFVDFENANINVTKTASIKSLKEAAKAFLDKVLDDLRLIDTQEHKDEITVEYKRTLNVAHAITSVTERHRAIEVERQRQEQLQAIKEKEQNTVEQLHKAQPLTAPAVASDDDKVIIMSVGKVKAKKSDCRILKQLLTNGNYEIIKTENK